VWILKFAMKKTTQYSSIENNISFSVGLFIIVEHYFEKLGLKTYLKTLVLRKKEEFVKRLILLVCNRLEEYFSINYCANTYGQNIDFLKEIDLKSFVEKTLYRDVKDLGENFYSSIHYLNRSLGRVYEFSKERINIDWSSITLFGEKCNLAKYGFSKDHRPDKKQINFGVANIATKKNLPLMLTIQEGNIPDVIHFETIFRQCIPYVSKKSLFVYDNGGDSQKNRNQVLEANMHLLTRKRINSSDKQQLDLFQRYLDNEKFDKITIINKNRKVYGFEYKPINSKFHTYYFFSQELYDKKMKSKNKTFEKKFLEAQKIETYYEKHKKLPSKYQIKNPLIEIKLTYQKRLKKLDKTEAKKLLQKENLSNFEGYFALQSSTKLTIK
jgi:transposase